VPGGAKNRVSIFVKGKTGFPFLSTKLPKLKKTLNAGKKIFFELTLGNNFCNMPKISTFYAKLRYTFFKY
jgi:hypothetical protein